MPSMECMFTVGGQPPTTRPLSPGCQESPKQAVFTSGTQETFHLLPASLLNLGSDFTSGYICFQTTCLVLTQTHHLIPKLHAGLIVA